MKFKENIIPGLKRNIGEFVERKGMPVPRMLRDTCLWI